MSPPIRTTIVDDEPMARQILRRLLASDAEILVVGEGDAVSLLPRLAPQTGEPELVVDLLFLDIEMPEVSGFELLARLPAAAIPVVVFVTAFDRYALQAFEVHALDYLVKPFSDSRFAAALAQAKARVREKSGLGGPEVAALLAGVRAEREQRPVDRLLVPLGQKLVVVPVADIDWIEAADYYARLHCGSRSYLLREPLERLERKLDASQFFRIHRSAIVQLDRVVEVHPHITSDLVVVLRGGRQLTLSRSRRRAFEQRLGQGR